MRLRTRFALFSLAACTGDDATPTDPIDCESIVAEPLGEVGTFDWPDGVEEALAQYATLQGVFDVDSTCGDNVSVKLTHPPQEQLEIVTEPWPDVPGLPCGCTVDQEYDFDPAYELVMLHYGFEVFVDDFPDPAVDDVIQITEGAFYQPGQPLEFRSCANTDINPLIESLYTNMSYVVRVPADGALEMDIVLNDENGASFVCELTDFQPQY